MAKPSKEKFAVRALRGSRAARALADDTLTRMTTGFTKILAGTYDTKELLNDMMGQTSDVIDAVREFMGGSGDTPQVIIIAEGATVYPVGEPALLSDNVKGSALRRTKLVGLTEAAAANTIPDADWDVVNVDDSNIGGNQQVEQVRVRLNAAPPATGVYRAALMSGTTKVLAQVVVVFRP
jgi:hypothetical protein